MKRFLRKIMMSAWMVLISFSLKAQLSIVFDEGFENGMPVGWTQEQVMGNFSWVVEDGDLTRPSGAYGGSKRVAFRNPTSQTRHYVTKLITPVMDLTGVYQPILCFAHAQDKWTDDFDMLKIYYRTSPDADWVLLKRYDEYLPEWQADTIMLVGVTDSYQLAFEATDNLGRGVVLDNIQVRSMPNCLQPDNLMAGQISNNSVMLSWNGSFDTETFHVKVSTVPLGEMTLGSDDVKADIVDELVSGEFYQLNITGLEAATEYYCYVKANCASESSFWSNELIFKTSNLISVPYFQSFDMEYTAGFINRMDDWYYGTSTDDLCPFVNTSTWNYDLPEYSPNATTVLFFSGKKDVGTPINAGEWAYAATPEVDIKSLSDIQVSFISVTKNADVRTTNRIIVGVMSDPTDLTTFVPVDTVKNSDYRIFEEFIVSFENYEGDGHHVALVSDFDGPNIFLVEDFKITLRPECPKAQFTYQVPSATDLKVICKEAAGYGCEVYVADTELDVEDMDMSHVIAQKTSNSSDCTVSGLTPWSVYYVYVRVKCGESYGEWSNCRKVRMPGQVDILPYLVDFEIDKNDPDSYYRPDNSQFDLSSGVIVLTKGESNSRSTDRHVYTNNLPQLSGYELELVAEKGGSTFAVFPYNTYMENTRVGFYSSAHSTYDYPACYYVGVMSDARDTATFVPLDTIEPEIGYKRYVVDLDRYKGNGKFFAVKVPYIQEYGRKNYAFIDNLLFETIPTCASPDNIIISPLHDGARISWSANGTQEWNVLVSDKMVLYDSINNISYEDILNGTYDIGLSFVDTVQSASVSVRGLFSGNKEYYVYLRPVCDGIAGCWTAAERFVTTCRDKEPLPYVMNFDKAPDGTPYPAAGSWNSPWPISCTWAVYDSYYYMQLSDKKSFSGNNSLNFQWSTSYLVYPDMDIEDINDLQVSFWMENDLIADVLEVGVMTDPLDVATFELVETVVPETVKEFREYIVPMTGYEGNGRYIAIRSNSYEGRISSIHLDSVVIEPKVSCVKIQKVRAESVTAYSAILTWNGYDETSWRLVVTTRELTVEQLNAADGGNENIIFVGDVTDKPYTLDGLESNSVYFVYVQAICSSTERGKWSSAGKFSTNCAPINVKRLGVEKFDAYGVGPEMLPTCYTAGNVASDNPAYIPHCDNGYRHSGASSLKIRSTVENNGAYAITPELDIDLITRLRVRFYGSAAEYITDQYAHRLVVGVVTDPFDLATFTPVDTLDFFNKETGYEVRFDNYSGDYDDNFGKYVMFFSEFDKENIVFIDDVVFDTIPDCSSPRIKISQVTVDGCEIEFEGGRSPYTVVVSPSLLRDDFLVNLTEKDSDSGVEFFNVTDASLLLTGLKSGSDYFVYAGSDCGSGLEWSGVKSFTVECSSSVSLPFVDDFDNNAVVGHHSNPRCWTSYYSYEGYETKYPCVDAIAYSGNSVLVYSSGVYNQSYLVSPLIDADLKECQVSFYAKSDNTTNTSVRNIIVGVADDISSPDAIKMFTPVDTIIIFGSYSFSKYVIPLADYAGTGKYVVFTNSFNDNHYNINASYGVSGGYYIDNVEVDLIPSCYSPDNFIMKGATDKDMTFTFGTFSDARRFEIEYGISGFIPGNGSVLVADTTMFSIEGLMPSTEYDVYVRTVCSEDDKSVWTFAGTWSTIPSPIAVYPFACDFEDETINSMWTLTRPDYRNQWHIGSAYSKDGEHSLYISYDNGNTAEYDIYGKSYAFAYMPVRFTEGVYGISFDWTCFGEGAYDFLRGGFLPLSSVFGKEDNKVIAADGTVVELNSVTVPKGWIEMNANSRSVRFNEVDINKPADEQWVHNVAEFVVDSEMEGNYWMVFYWQNDNSGGNHPRPSAVVDNILISKNECGAAVDLIVNNITDKSAEFTWNTIGDNSSAYRVVVYDSIADGIGDGTGEHCIIFETVDEMKFVADALVSDTRYYVYVQPLCDGGVGKQSEMVTFVTPCVARPAGVIFDFEDSEEVYYKEYETGVAQNKYPIPDCFESLNPGLEYYLQNAAYFPYREGNKDYSYYNYAHSGYYALYFSSNNAAQSGGYMVLPKFEEEIKDLEISFWMRPFTEMMSGNINSLTPLSQNYTRSITVGTMTDPSDESTFVPVSVVTYPLTDVDLKTTVNTANDPLGERYWRKFTVLFSEAEGDYIAFRNEAVGTVVMNKMYIDDIEVSRISRCPIPYDVRVTGVTDTHVSGAFAHKDGEMWIVKLSESADMSDCVFIDTVSVPEFEFDGLLQATSYYVSVSQLCGIDEQSKWTAPLEFTTSYAVRFTEDFSKNTRVPDKWLRAVSPKAESLFDGKGIWSYQDNSDAVGWCRDKAMFASGLFSTDHISVELLYYSSYFWLQSPDVYIPRQGNCHLTFDLALTGVNSNGSPVTDNSYINDHTFMVVISTDGGVSWNRENATVWNNTGSGDYLFNAIPNIGCNYSLNMDKYAGMNVKVAFYAEAGLMGFNTALEIHLDNVRINSYVERYETGDICQKEDYRSRLFSIPDTLLRTGNNRFERILMPLVNEPDTLVKLDLAVTPVVETVMEDHVCEGYIYTGYDFEAEYAGVFRRKLTSANGCDSIVTLRLMHEPTRRVSVYDTICQGAGYVFNGKEYNRTGVYSDTLVSKVTGCDSIVMLSLKVNGALMYDNNVIICQGSTYSFGKYGDIAQSGVYTDNFVTSEGCDSMVTLNLTVLPDLRQTIKAVICDGDVYDGNGFSGISIAGEYVLPLTDGNGCDSTVTLVLTVLSGDTTRVEYTVMVDELPYEYETIRYKEGTPVGVYTDTISVSAGNCDNIVIHTLNVNPYTGVGNTSCRKLQIVPNPVSVMQEITVSAEMDNEDKVLLVEIFDMTGRCIYRTTAGTYPVTVPGIGQEGAYLLRITAESGNIWQSKLIVK